jgi:hypothetical protein
MDQFRKWERSLMSHGLKMDSEQGLMPRLLVIVDAILSFISVVIQMPARQDRSLRAPVSSAIEVDGSFF